MPGEMNVRLPGPLAQPVRSETVMLASRRVIAGFEVASRAPFMLFFAHFAIFAV